MRLVDLDAQFVALGSQPGSHRDVETLVEAQGVEFLCPKCFEANGGPVRTHMVLCWFTGVPADVRPGPGRWNPSGTGLDDLTFVGPGAVSVDLSSTCGWHGFVRDGEASA